MVTVRDASAAGEQSISASALRYLARHSEQTNSITIKKLSQAQRNRHPTASEHTRNSSLTSDIGIHKLLVF